MQLSVTGQQLEVDVALRRRNETNQTASVIKYLDGANEADLVFAREVVPFGAAISSPTGQGTPFRGLIEADDPCRAFDTTFCTQLRRRPASPPHE